jgi:putative transposase
MACSPNEDVTTQPTTDGDHANPIYPDRARDLVVDGPNQLWVADITYITITPGFVYLAAIVDAWSRRVVGYAISRSIDARLATAALKAAVRARQPPSGGVHHSDRGSQYASDLYRQLLAEHRLIVPDSSIRSTTPVVSIPRSDI